MHAKQVLYHRPVLNFIYLKSVSRTFHKVSVLDRLFRLFQDRVSLCSPGCPGTHRVDQAVFKLRDPPASIPSAGIKDLRHYDCQ